MLSGRRRSRTFARSRNRLERAIAADCCRSRKASPLARSGGESASARVAIAPEKPHVCGEKRAPGAFQRARCGSDTSLPKILTFDRTQSAHVADAGLVSGRSPGHSTTYVTQPPSGQRAGCNERRLHEACFSRRQRVRPTDTASTGPENPHLSLTRKCVHGRSPLAARFISLLGRPVSCERASPRATPESSHLSRAARAAIIRSGATSNRRAPPPASCETASPRCASDRNHASQETIRNLSHRRRHSRIPSPSVLKCAYRCAYSHLCGSRIFSPIDIDACAAEYNRSRRSITRREVAVRCAASSPLAARGSNGSS